MVEEQHTGPYVYNLYSETAALYIYIVVAKTLLLYIRPHCTG
jgi:hypothetical protein